MKTLVISLVLVLIAAVTQAQNVIELNETKVEYNPLFSKMTQRGNMYIMKVNENHNGQLEKDPMAFLNKNFDIKEFIAYVKDNNQNYDSYEVNFTSNKGVLMAEYDKFGNLDYITHKFKDITLPYAVTQKIFLENEGWSVVKNMHIGSGKDGRIDKAYYKVTMQNGKQKKNIKIDATPGEAYQVASKM